MPQTVFITGTSTGIGAATVRLFARHGWQVAATMRNPADAKFGDLPNVRVYALDVTDAAAAPRAIAQAHADFGGLDVLINNAGYGLVGPFEAATDEQIQQQFATNVFGVFAVTRAALPLLRAQQSGVIVNITSVGGRTAFPMNSLYHATKFGLDGFSESLWYELAPFGIRVKVVAPGGVATDFGTRSLQMTIDPADDQAPYVGQVRNVLKAFGERRGAASTAEQIADVIYAAATDGTAQLRYIAGADAQGLLSTKAQMPEGDFMAMIQKSFSGE
ncbi:SDR family oxidoreductase [Hymenobacter sp. PAMC 26628]|uniref:SDR family oxidoreductase n=1 Tax=Hymenobacter sp. PAMC 26628 TaxID=1484118 RepID=UPI00077049DB|nr:SDR family oxidoreductase [Hymenobacter sp. PAMC 26628]AMJ66558.1 short-chain dehydrogenase [Hymenobacter sp. PAMC 26628]